jgi:tryptophanyl-tRNA synthetase
LSLLQPTGEIHLGNYVGAIRHWALDQHEKDCFFGMADLHALTADHDPATLAEKTLQGAAILLAAGLDPEVCTIFVQGHVPAHSELGWIMSCVTSFGELSRMTQFKAKADEREFVSAGLFAYPSLMAADILLYDADEVPVGDDQRQHLELTRDAAERFNSRYGQTFTVPKAAIPRVGARIMDLQDPAQKMSKSKSSPTGKINVLESSDDIVRKIKRAVTDSDSEVLYDPATKPGVSNLLELIAAGTGDSPSDIAARYTQYGPLKADAAASVVELLRPFHERFDSLMADPAEVQRILEKGAAKASAVAEVTLTRARNALGLLPR